MGELGTGELGGVKVLDSGLEVVLLGSPNTSSSLLEKLE